MLARAIYTCSWVQERAREVGQYLEMVMLMYAFVRVNMLFAELFGAIRTTILRARERERDDFNPETCFRVRMGCILFLANSASVRIHVLTFHSYVQW